MALRFRQAKLRSSVCSFPGCAANAESRRSGVSRELQAGLPAGHGGPPKLARPSAKLQSTWILMPAISKLDAREHQHLSIRDFLRSSGPCAARRKELEASGLERGGARSAGGKEK